jgi:hypothetical protein
MLTGTFAACLLATAFADPFICCLQTVFPSRTRKQLVRKFKAEEKRDKRRVRITTGCDPSICGSRAVLRQLRCFLAFFVRGGLFILSPGSGRAVCLHEMHIAS